MEQKFVDTFLSKYLLYIPQYRVRLMDFWGKFWGFLTIQDTFKFVVNALLPTILETTQGYHCHRRLNRSFLLPLFIGNLLWFPISNVCSQQRSSLWERFGSFGGCQGHHSWHEILLVRFTLIHVIRFGTSKFFVPTLSFHDRLHRNYLICKQESVFRVNCVDCLDRTNLVQSVFATSVIEIQVRPLLGDAL